MIFKVFLMDVNEEEIWSPKKLFRSIKKAENFINDPTQYNSDGGFNGWIAEIYPCDRDGDIIDDKVVTITELTNE